VEGSESLPVVENCPSCGGAIDVSDELPFAQICCPHCGEEVRARRSFNNFDLVELIGEGGMGSVFKAYDRNLGRLVALKVLRREMSARQDERARLEQEARITASVNHPHVVRVYAFGEASGQFYLAMELVEKGSLDELMSVQGRVSEVQALGIGVQIAQGLEAAAEKGLVHRDVKPGNILFADARTAKIVDFGLARVLEEEAGARGEIWGTPYYIAPERLNYESEDFRSDMYSLGGTLFHAIAGRPPFEAESASLVALKQLKSQPVSLEAFAPDVAPETAYVINRMLEKNPSDRYASYPELVEHLEFARAKVMENAGRSGEAKREVVKVETNRTKAYIALISIVTALLLLGVAVWLFLASERPEIKELRDALGIGG
jgi:serine/threonine protein kinase